MRWHHSIYYSVNRLKLLPNSIKWVIISNQKFRCLFESLVSAHFVLNSNANRSDHKPKLLQRKIRNSTINQIYIFEFFLVLSRYCDLCSRLNSNYLWKDLHWTEKLKNKDRFLLLMWLLHQNEIDGNFNSIRNDRLFSICLSRWFVHFC